MKFNRRSFIGFLGLQYATLKAAQAQNRKAHLNAVSGKWPALQGATDAESTQIVWSIPKGENVVFQLETPNGIKTLTPSQVFTESTSNWQQVHFYINDLVVGVDYRLNILRGGKLYDSRVFQALKEDGKSLNHAVISCMNDFFYKENVWEELEKAKPEVIFMIGDSCYADFVKAISLKPANRAQMWKRYMETRNKIRFYLQERLVPVFAVWDDHDYGSNNGDRNFQYKADALAIWPAFFPRNPNRVYQVGPGISSVLTIRGQRFFLLDNRTFRSTPGEANPAYFGSDQETWALNIMAAKRMNTMLMAGTQWFGGYRKKESYEYAHPDLLKAFLTEVKKTRCYVIFVSGDIHMSELMNIESDWLGYNTYEITSSAMHSLSGPGWSDRLDNPRRLMHVVASNFKMIKSYGGFQYICEVKCIKNTGAIAYEHMLGVTNGDDENDTAESDTDREPQSNLPEL